MISLVNEVDGDALITLLDTLSGPDCLKELVPEIGVRMKVYKLIKTHNTNDCVSFELAFL